MTSQGALYLILVSLPSVKSVVNGWVVTRGDQAASPECLGNWPTSSGCYLASWGPCSPGPPINRFSEWRWGESSCVWIRSARVALSIPVVRPGCTQPGSSASSKSSLPSPTCALCRDGQLVEEAPWTRRQPHMIFPHRLEL